MRDRVAVLLAALYFSTPASGDSFECNQMTTTVAISKCKIREFGAVEDKLTKYLEASVQHYDDDPVVVKAIRESQEQWEAYSTAHCDAIYAKWRGNPPILSAAQKWHQAAISFCIGVMPPRAILGRSWL